MLGATECRLCAVALHDLGNAGAQRDLTGVVTTVGRVQRAEERFGVDLWIVDGYGGHGSGREMHEEPYLANEGRPGRGPFIEEGSTLAIEPMLALGTADSRVLDDDWGVVTLDGSWASHWEHTVAVTEDGPWLLTAPAGAPDRPGA